MPRKESKVWSTSNTVLIALGVTVFFIVIVVAAGAFPAYIPSSIKDAAVGGVLAGIVTIVARVFGVGTQTRLSLRSKKPD